MITSVPRVALVGPGAIGVTFAAALQDAGVAAASVCARRPIDAPRLRRDGAPELTLAGPVLTDPAAVRRPADWVLCAVKAHQVAGAAGWLRALCGPGTVIVALMNGIEHRELLGPHVGAATVLPAVVWAPASPEADGAIRLHGPARLTVPDDDAGRAFALLMEEGFGTVSLAEDFAAEAWRKLLTNAVAGLMAVADRSAALFTEPDVDDVVVTLLREGVAVARSTGVTLPDEVGDGIRAWMAALPPEATTSILVDRRAGRPLEWEARNGVIGRLGRAHGVPTPANDVLTALLRQASAG